MFGKYKYMKFMASVLIIYCIGASEATSYKTRNSNENLFDCSIMNQTCKNLRDCRRLLLTIPANATKELKKIVKDQIEFCKVLYRDKNGLMNDQLSWDGRCTLICDKIHNLGGCQGKCGDMPKFPTPWE